MVTVTLLKSRAEPRMAYVTDTHGNKLTALQLFDQLLEECHVESGDTVEFSVMRMAPGADTEVR
jgi:hypothetical protein